MDIRSDHDANLMQLWQARRRTAGCVRGTTPAGEAFRCKSVRARAPRLRPGLKRRQTAIRGGLLDGLALNLSLERVQRCGCGMLHSRLTLPFEEERVERRVGCKASGQRGQARGTQRTVADVD